MICNRKSDDNMRNPTKKPKISKAAKKEINKLVRIISRGIFPEIEVARLGENRGQLFVRIPKSISDRMGFEKGQPVKLTVVTEEEENKLSIEAIS